MSRTLFVGDVHGCAAELGALLERAQASRVVLLGDLFTKGPDPQGVWALIQRHGCESVLGNHDAAVLEGQGGGLPAAALEWLGQRPITLRGPGWLAVHAGVDPVGGAPVTQRMAALNMRRWPDDTTAEAAHWWHWWRGPPLVIHGHDARVGLNDRRPHSLGLDGGCVYGGRLHGFVWETGELLSVAAARAYRPV